MVLPSLNFVAAGNTITHTGAEPVFCDIRGERDLNLDPDDVVWAITPEDKSNPRVALRRVPMRPLGAAGDR